MSSQEAKPNAFDLDAMPEFTADSIAGEADGLTEGMYQLAITKEAEPLTSKAGQAMIRLQFGPCRVKNDPRSADASQRLEKYLMLPFLVDRARYAEAQNEKAGMTLGAAEVDAAWKQAQVRAEQDVTNTVGALIGYDKLPEVPRWDKEARVYRDKGGEIFSKTQVVLLAKVRAAAAINLLKAEIKATGLVGYSAYAKVELEEFNNQPRPVVKALYEKLPDGAALKPLSKWFVKE